MPLSAMCLSVRTRATPGYRRDRLGSRVVADVKRVCLLGAESTGKSTLAEALASRFDTLWNPEYGRPYTQIGRPADAPWTSWEFTHIARVHCWYEDFLATLSRARPVLGHGRVHDQRLPRGLPRHSGHGVRGARRTAVRPVRRLRPRCAVATRRDSGVRGAAPSRCTTGTWSARAGAEARGCSSKGRPKCASRPRPREVERLLDGAIGVAPCAPPTSCGAHEDGTKLDSNSLLRSATSPVE